MYWTKRLTVLACLTAGLLLMLICAGCGGSNSALDRPGGTGEGAAVKAGLDSSDKPVSVPDAFPREGGVPLYAHLFDGGSYDAGGTIVKWEWNFTDGGGGWHDYTATEGDAWHEYDKPGNRQVHLRVTDNEGNTDVAHVEVVMRQGLNANPVAVASATPATGNAPLTVQLSAEGSYDPDGTIEKYEWDFGEGFDFVDCSSLGGGTTHIYETAGVYTAILRVTDDDGAESTNSVELDVAPPLAGRGEWWMQGHDARHTRRSGNLGPQSYGLKWSHDTGNMVWSSAAVAADGTVFIGSGGSGATLYAFRPDGTLKWTSPVKGYVYSSPAIGTDGTLYVGSGGKICAVDPATGDVIWYYQTGDSIRLSSPALAEDGTVYVGSLDDQLYAINPGGTLKWSRATGGNIESSPAVAPSGSVYVGSLDHKVYAFSSEGTPEWVFPTTTEVWASPAIGADGTVYIASRLTLYALTPNGTKKWERSGGGAIYGSPAIGFDGTIYLCGNDGVLRAYSSVGVALWACSTGRNCLSSPAIGADGTIYLGTKGTAVLGSQIYAFNPGGAIKWSGACENVSYSCPAIGPDGSVYVGSELGKVFAFGVP